MSCFGPFLVPLLAIGQPILTEIAPNPIDEGSGEFVEIFNPASDPICLSGYSITDGDALDELVPWDEQAFGTFPHPGMLTGTDTLPAGSFALVFELDYLLSPCYPDIPQGTLILTTADHSICNGLAASSDPLTLFDEGGSSDSSAVSTWGTPVPSDQWQDRDDDGLDSIPFDPGDGCTVERFPWDSPDMEGCWLTGPTGGTPGRHAETPPDTVNISCDSVWTEPAVPDPVVPFTVAASVTCWGNSVPQGGSLTVFMDADGDSVAGPGEVLAVFDASILQPGMTDTLFTSTTAERGWYLPSCTANVAGDSCIEDDHACSFLPVGGGVDPVITEVMANPVNEDTGEFIELHYPGPGIFPLAGCRFTDGDALDDVLPWTAPPLSDPDVLYSQYIRSGSYGLIIDPEYGDGFQVYDIAPGTVVATVGNTTVGNGLAGTDPVTLYDPWGTTQASVLSTFGTPLSSDDPLQCDDDGLDDIPFLPDDGTSLERRSWTLPDAEGSWVISPPGGTPGSPALVEDTTDACVYSLTVTPYEPDPYTPVSLDAVIINSGTVEIPTAPVVLFLDSDADSSGSPGEVLLESTVGPVSPGGSVDLQVTFTCPVQGWYLAAAAVSAPGDLRPSNDAMLTPFPSGGGVDPAITEVICNPSSEDTDELIEIHYPGPGVIDLSGFSFTDGDAIDVIEPWSTEAGFLSDPDAVYGCYLTAGGYGVILDSEYGSGMQPYDLPSGTSVMTTNNTTLGDGLTSTDPLTLYGPSGTGLGDVMSTFGTPLQAEDPLGRDDDGYDGIPFDPGEDQSLQRLQATGPDHEENWAVSPAGPTPGGPFPECYLGVNCSAVSVACSPPMGFGDEPGLLTAVVACTGTDPVSAGELSAEFYCDLDYDGLPEPEELAGTALAGPVSPGDTLEMQVEWTSVQQATSVFAVLVCDLDMLPSDDTASCLWNSAGPLVLSEVMYAPAPGEPEWIELLNVSQATVCLLDWRFEDSAEGVLLCADSVMLEPGGFAVAVADSAEFRAVWPEVACPVVVPVDWPALNNSTQQGQDYADLLTLRDPAANPADFVPYDDDWGGGTGISLERISGDQPGWDQGNWAGCSCEGTPGAANSCSGGPGGGGFLEYGPDPFSPDGDGRDDTLVISINPDGASLITLTVYNVQGRVSRELLVDHPCSGTLAVVWDGTDAGGQRLPLGRYILYLRSRDAVSGEVRESCGVVVLALPL